MPARHKSRQYPATLAGIALMIAAIGSWSVMDALAKYMASHYSVAQIACLRSVFGLVVVLGATLPAAGIAGLRMQRPLWHIARALFGSGAMLGFFYALKYLPLADVVMIGFASPVIVTALSRPLLGEAVGPQRWAGVLAGLLGVAVVLRPGAGLFELPALVALGATACYAMMTLSARLLRDIETAAVLTVWPAVGPIVIGGALMGPVWVTPDPRDWGLFALMGLLGGMAFLCAVASLRRAEAVVVVPFEYTGIIWAALIGYLYWGDIPSLNTLAGGAIVIAAGLFIAVREVATSRTGASRTATVAVPDTPPPRSD